ncbi:hypothetical protein BH11BAC1_BH11BAC1_27900 [soil metagenome]
MSSNYHTFTSGTFHYEAINSHGCLVAGGIAITVNTSPPVNITLYNDTLFATTTNNTFSFQWSLNGIPILHAVGATYHPSQPGIYYCCVQGYNACPSRSNEIYYQVCALGNTTVSNATLFNLCDGSATVNILGTAPFIYQWSTGETINNISGLCEGTYYFTITDSIGCVVYDSIVISQPAPICDVIITSVNNMLCNGNCTGSLTAVANGLPSFHFLWSTQDTTPTINNLCAGVYSVVMTDSVGCIDSATVVVTEPPPIISIINADYFNCTCTYNMIVTGGTPPLAYLWCDGSIGQQMVNCSQGVCLVSIVDANGCMIQDTVSMNPPAQLSIVLSSDPATCIGCSDGTASVAPNGGQPPYTYLWSTGGVFSSITGLSAGIYTVCVTDLNQCIVCDTITVLEDPTGTFTIGLTQGVKVNPNPFSDETILEVNGSILFSQIEFTLTDILGNVITEFPIVEPKTIISRKHIAAGIYLYRLNSKYKNIVNGKLIVVD